MHINDTIIESGNMLIMLYAHARFSGDGSLIQLIHRHVRECSYSPSAEAYITDPYSTTLRSNGQTISSTVSRRVCLAYSGYP